MRPFTGRGHPLCRIDRCDEAADGVSPDRDVKTGLIAAGVLFHLPRRRETKAREVWHIEPFSASFSTNESPRSPIGPPGRVAACPTEQMVTGDYFFVLDDDSAVSKPFKILQVAFDSLDLVVDVLAAEKSQSPSNLEPALDDQLDVLLAESALLHARLSMRGI